MSKPRILVLTPYFLPSRHGGGSVTAMLSLIEHLKGDYEFVVAAGAFDLHATEPYPESTRLQAQSRTGVEILYLPRGRAAVPMMRSLLSQHWELIYLNSFLSPVFAALPLLLRRLGRRRPRLLIAPRGELMAGALGERRCRKLLYLRTLQGLGLLRGAGFHATSEPEAQELRQFGLVPIRLAADLPPLLPAPPAPHPKFEDEPLRIVFLSRIEAKKNLLFALEVLAHVSVPISFDVIGPVGDPSYWAACCEAMADLPACVKASYLGPVEPEQVLDSLANYELFMLPTRAENNGYVIHEALLAGCSVLISDQTPWRQLAQARVGADLPLLALDFAKAIAEFARMSATERLAQRHRAQAYGLARLEADTGLAATRAMFAQAIASD